MTEEGWYLPSIMVVLVNIIIIALSVSLSCPDVDGEEVVVIVT
jgi:hypothetical protein